MEIFTITGRNYDSNIFLLLGEHPTMIDTGTGLYSKEVLRTIQKFITPSAIEYLVLTHEHYDHVGGVPGIQHASGNNAKVASHQKAVEKLASGKSSLVPKR